MFRLWQNVLRNKRSLATHTGKKLDRFCICWHLLFTKHSSLTITIRLLVDLWIWSRVFIAHLNRLKTFANCFWNIFNNDSPPTPQTWSKMSHFSYLKMLIHCCFEALAHLSPRLLNTIPLSRNRSNRSLFLTLTSLCFSFIGSSSEDQEPRVSALLQAVFQELQPEHARGAGASEGPEVCLRRLSSKILC